MRKIIALVVALFLVLAMSNNSYSAEDKGGKPGGPGGCGSTCRTITVLTKYDSWTQDVTWVQGPIEDLKIFEIRATIGTLYHFWPDGKHKDKLSPYRTEICYSFVREGDGFLYDGIKGTVRYRDDTKHFNVPTIRVQDDGRQNCNSYRIPVKYRHWYNMGESPELAGVGSVVRHVVKDVGFRWRFGKSKYPYKYFHPLHDLNIEGPHRIIKAW